MFWWVELDLFSLECNDMSTSEFWGIYKFGMTLGNLSFSVQGSIPVFSGELAWCVLHWNLLAFGWSLVAGQVWRFVDELLSIKFP